MPGQTHRGWRPCAVKIIPLEYYIMNQNPSIRKLVRCGVVAAIYVVLCMALQPLSYGAVQVRVAEALCLLPVFGAEYIAGVVLGCFLANLLGSTIVDVIFGTLATLLACITNGISVGIGELISCTVLGVLLVKIIESSKALNELFAAE